MVRRLSSGCHDPRGRFNQDSLCGSSPRSAFPEAGVLFLIVTEKCWTVSGRVSRINSGKTFRCYRRFSAVLDNREKMPQPLGPAAGIPARFPT
jgi:hypothetical protein